MRRFALAAAVLSAAACAADRGSTATAAAAAKSTPAPVTGPRVVMPSGAVISVEIAVTDAEKAQGLMFRESMPKNAGMVFPFEGLEIRPFWMKNCHFPLDLVYATKDGTVVEVIKAAPALPARPGAVPEHGPEGESRHRPRGERGRRGRDGRRARREAQVGRDPGAMTSVLRSAVTLAADLTRFRDADTGTHLDRVSRYARLVAEALGLQPGFVEELAALAPAHDVGKLAIPDQILLKQGTLEPLELEVMRGHVASGVAVVEDLVRAFDLGGSPRSGCCATSCAATTRTWTARDTRTA